MVDCVLYRMNDIQFKFMFVRHFPQLMGHAIAGGCELEW